MRKGMQGLALLVQQGLQRNPHGGDLFVFPGRAGALVKIIWHDGVGMSLYAKRLEKGRFIWPSAKDGMVQRTRPILPPSVPPMLRRVSPMRNPGPAPPKR
ncbi:IS66 family insertion sequence element accessory protein TnpB [Novosphingobium sp. SG720]|uniref:IS66 family insertion sequence element accessory protein TnpB n=1 Tax=Novosphingobium sp. SG720 TaxID=2586998 RepID=UPI001803DABF|nr:IS66 family insertion sequence element accessory protein TnpB [Novosphingobium sp. SG720]NKJ44255.1 transposase [Novosphingobium sp. SG720]